MDKIIKQHDIRDCGAACLASISAHYNVGIPIARIRQYASTDKDGTNILGLVRGAEKIGFEAKGVKGSLDSLPFLPYPAIAHVVRRTDDNMEYHHFVALYAEKDDKIQMMDPGYGTMEWVKKDDFKKEWSGALVLLEPKSDFVERDETVSVFSKFKNLVWPHKSILLQALIGAVIYTALGLSSSIYIEKITDYVLVGGNTNLLNLLSVTMLLIVILKFSISMIQGFIVMRTGQMIDANLILGYYKHLLKLPQSFFDTMQIGEITSRISDAVKIRNFINDTVISLIVNFLIVILSFALMFVYYWKLALIMLIVIPLYGILYVITDKWNKKIERKVMEDAASLESQLVESLNAEKTIKQFGIESYANEKTENRFAKMLYSIYGSGKCGMIAGGFSELISSVFTVIMIWSGSYFVLDGHITAGELMSFYAIVGYFTSPVASLITSNKSIQDALIAADRLFEIMELEREETSDKIELKRDMVGDVGLCDVKFSYGTNRDVFDNLNMCFKRGQMTAIVGESGCGKTTIANLLQNLYPLKSGKIMVGDYILADLSNHSIRTLISAVPQQITLFSGTIIQNIALGEYEPNLERVATLTRKLGLSDFIEKLPQGYNTQVGENGSMLSGGQKQRLAIARALYKNPEILILDEATSALDSMSEQYVQSVIQDLRRDGKTIIVIAHRISTIRNADSIYVMKEGKITEYGTYDELQNKNGEFNRLWKSSVNVN